MWNYGHIYSIYSKQFLVLQVDYFPMHLVLAGVFMLLSCFKGASKSVALYIVLTMVIHCFRSRSSRPFVG